MAYVLRPTRTADLPTVLALIADAQEQLRRAGIDQWQDGYPNRQVIEKDMEAGHSFVVVREGEIVATVMISFDGEPTYQEIHGAWLTNTSYAVIHRLAVRSSEKGKNIAGQIIGNVEKECSRKQIASIRIDTHCDNLAMQRAAEKAGFRYCGTITLTSGASRLAYEKVLL